VRIIYLTAAAAVFVGGAILGGPADAHSVPVTGGCYGGSSFSQRPVPGTGSLGQDVVRTATLFDCASPLLPGIVVGVLTLTAPDSPYAPAPATGDIAWSNGRQSAISGVWQDYGWNPYSPASAFAITGGPGAGHHLLLNVSGATYHLGSAVLEP
jgi:hypothetical protein